MRLRVRPRPISGCYCSQDAGLKTLEKEIAARDAGIVRLQATSRCHSQAYLYRGNLELPILLKASPEGREEKTQTEAERGGHDS